MKNSIFEAFLFGIIKGAGCGFLIVVLLLILMSLTIGINGGLVNAYTLPLCVVGAIPGAVLGGIISAINCAVRNANLNHPSVQEKRDEDEPPIAKP